MQNDSKLLPELNLRVIVLGLLLSVIMGSANVYLGLKAGMTVSASIPAAVLGMLALKYFSRMSGTSNSILEANQIQTAASAGESLAAGIIFTMPALILIGVWQSFDMYPYNCNCFYRRTTWDIVYDPNETGFHCKK